MPLYKTRGSGVRWTEGRHCLLCESDSCSCGVGAVEDVIERGDAEDLRAALEKKQSELEAWLVRIDQAFDRIDELKSGQS